MTITLFFLQDLAGESSERHKHWQPTINTTLEEYKSRIQKAVATLAGKWPTHHEGPNKPQFLLSSGMHWRESAPNLQRALTISCGHDLMASLET